MRRFKVNKKNKGFAATLLLLILVTCFTVAPILLAMGSKKIVALVSQELSKVVDRKIDIDGIDLDGFKGVSVNGLQVEKTSDSDMISGFVASVDIEYDLLSILKNKSFVLNNISKVRVNRANVSYNLKMNADNEPKAIDQILKEICTELKKADFNGILEIVDSCITLMSDSGEIKIEQVNAVVEVSETIVVKKFSGNVDNACVKATGFIALETEDVLQAEFNVEINSLDLNRYGIKIADEKLLNNVSGSFLLSVSKDIEINRVVMALGDSITVTGDMKLGMNYKNLEGKGVISVKNTDLFDEDLKKYVTLPLDISFSVKNSKFIMSIENSKILGIGSNLLLTASDISNDGFNFKANMSTDILTLNATGNVIKGKVKGAFDAIANREAIVAMLIEEYSLSKDLIDRDSFELILNGDLHGDLLDVKAEAMLNIKGFTFMDDVLSANISYDSSASELLLEAYDVNSDFGILNLLAGFNTKNNEVNLSLYSQNVDIAELAGLFSQGSGSYINGYFDATLNATYLLNRAKDALVAELTITHGKLSSPYLKDPISELKADIELVDKRILVRELTGIIPSGTIKAKGDLLVNRNEISEFDLHLSSDEITVVDNTVKSKLKLDLRAKKNDDFELIDGDVILSDLVIDINELMTNRPVESHNSVVQETAIGMDLQNDLGMSISIDVPSWLRNIPVDVKFHLDNRVRIVGKDIEIKAKPGIIGIGGTLGRPNFVGVIDVSGGLARLFTTEFEIIEGKLIIGNLKGAAPEIYVLAQPRLGRDFRVKVTGAVNDIQVEVFGKKPDSIKVTGDQIKDEIMKLIDPRLRLFIMYDIEEALVKRGIINDIELLNPNGEGLELQIGKEVSDNLYLCLRKSLNLSLSNKDSLEIEYKWTPNMVLSGNLRFGGYNDIKLDAKYEF